jgi:(1->4)-alpha-D-glucan 1-alpha-D-glucosylmutase
VDPDNRRPVDYERRRETLKSLDENTSKHGLAATAVAVMANPLDGRLKQFVTSRLLRARREHPGLFSAGEYIPIQASGARAANVFAFARVTQDRAALVAVPRFCAGLGIREGQWATGPEAWKDTSLLLPSQLKGRRWRNVFTGEEVAGTLSDHFGPPDLFPAFPVTVYVGAS